MLKFRIHCKSEDGSPVAFEVEGVLVKDVKEAARAEAVRRGVEIVRSERVAE